MENASKALLISGGVLLAMLLLSVFTYVFRNMASSTSNIYEELGNSEITEFNQRFLNYNGRSDLRIQDVVTIINLAKDSNNEGRVPVTVTVSFLGDNNAHNKSESDLAIWLHDKIGDKFSCTVNYASNSKYVGNIEIH